VADDPRTHPDRPDISLSVVSHSQIILVAELLTDLQKHCGDLRFEIILTLNLDESLPFALEDFSYPIRLVRNTRPLGFGANHNQAFSSASGRYFCIINPDIRLSSNPFSALLACLEDSGAGVAAPIVLGENGELEDNARRFPSPLTLIGKLTGKRQPPDYAIGNEPIFPDWVAGMFMLFRRAVFEELGGFDERYFLYYEDVNICARLRLRGHEAVLCPQASVVHHAQRHSHRNIRYMRWHLQSMARYLLSSAYWKIQCRR
jgi:hypothetical protein